MTRDEGKAMNGWGESAPSLDVEVRNSLILPGYALIFRNICSCFLLIWGIQLVSEILRPPSFRQPSA